jgi:hypothetical protein
MILLVVLGMLTFFSILIATYLVFANQSRQSSFVIASRNNRAPDVRELMDDALMTLIRGTENPADPFFGEDLLSDYYGRLDSITGSLPNPSPTNYSYSLGQRFARFIVNGLPDWQAPFDDLYAGRLITFTSANTALYANTMQVIRSRYQVGNPGVHTLVVELPENLVTKRVIGDPEQPSEVNSLFTSQDGRPISILINGAPRNSPGLGFQPIEGSGGGRVGIERPNLPQADRFFPGLTTLPMALQPNHFSSVIRDTQKVPVDPSTGLPDPRQGDFDESYDAADFNNWFLSYRDSEGRVIPSFHRPSVLNYILNQSDFTSALGNTDPRVRGNALVALGRSTFRPLPFAAGSVHSNSIFDWNSSFTGSNPNYALRTPITIGADSNANNFRIDQLAKALIGSPGDWNPWDVDNDGDGVADSVWIDLGLPVITSREGKLLKPLVAPMIEDLSARLNVNVHGNLEIPLARLSNGSNLVGGISGQATWAGSRTAFAASPQSNHFRGVGYGPAEIVIPRITGVAGIELERHQYGDRANVAVNQATIGLPGRDYLDLLRFGWRPPLHDVRLGYGYSLDPFGRAGIGLGRGGHLLMANSGLPSMAGNANEAIENPYEFDPSGRLAGDRLFTFEELEPLLRSNSFDVELLPNRLQGRLQSVMSADPSFARWLTTLSKSDDSLALPIDNTPNQPSFLKAMRLINAGLGLPLSVQQAEQLIAPEFRLGQKLDVNRPFGNGVDDNGNQVIDEPIEVVSENQAFAATNGAGQNLPPEYVGVPPEYRVGSRLDLQNTASDALGFPRVDGRQVLARHLFILMMALTCDVSADPATGALVIRTPQVPGLDPSVQIPAAQQQEYYTRRIAQWAVNVIDYRDPDAVMTRFVFDDNPFDGWNLPAEPAPAKNVAWGVEQPELVFSESLAFHDVRVRDTDRDSGVGTDKQDVNNPDTSTDQVRIPQGSLFLELYCPRATVESASSSNDQRSKQAFPRELYKFPGNANAGDPATLALDLSATAPPAANAGAVGAPVWRLAISRPHPDPNLLAGSADAGSPPLSNPTQDPWSLRSQNPDTASFDPDRPDLLLDPPQPVDLDRFVWFVDFRDPQGIKSLTDNIADMTGRHADVFFAPSTFDSNSDARIAPGQFLVLAPREETALGSVAFAPGSQPTSPSEQHFEIDATDGFVHTDTNHNHLTPAMGFSNPSPFAPSKPMVIGTFPPPGGWGNAIDNGVVGLNVSEPMPARGNYYPLPTERYNGNDADYPLEDAYVDLSAGNKTAPDRSLDVSRGRIPPGATNPEEPYLGTIPSYCTAFLQRLADPTKPYHEVLNPYRTVDAIPIDLSVFSGEEREQQVTGRDGEYFRRSRQRNGKVDDQRRDALFSYETTVPEDERLNPLGATYFEFNGQPHLYSSLSFLNTVYPAAGGGTPVNPAPSNANDAWFSPSLGMLGANAQNLTNFDRNLPQVPYAQHPWLNRPFATHLELAMVPACSQGRLFEEFSLPDPSNDPNVYAGPNPAAGDAQTIQRFYGPFRHLLNFFYGDSKNLTNDPFLRADHSRIFDFVHTLPRFKGEVEMIAPSRLGGITDAASRSWMLELYHPPFNFHYDGLRHGRINLNTLGGFPVWQGLMQGHMNDDEVSNSASLSQLGFLSFLRSRRGFDVSPNAPPQPFGSGGTVNYDPSRFDPRFPTEFAGVFRGHAEAGLAIRTSGTGPNSELLRRRGVDASYFRHRDILSTNDPPSEKPLFVRDNAQQPPPVAGAGDHSRDRQRDAFIRHQTLMRMANLASDNSQTFVVWMTIGFFEVDETWNNLAPGGVWRSMGREYNEDIGQNQRYQAMFIIDRSRPVGFLPGQNLNARDVVVFEKYFQ